MTQFTPCKRKTACRDDGRQCLVCGRSFEEIARTRELIDALADFARAQDYDNINEFADYIARKLEKKAGTVGRAVMMNRFSHRPDTRPVMAATAALGASS